MAPVRLVANRCTQEFFLHEMTERLEFPKLPVKSVWGQRLWEGREQKAMPGVRLEMDSVRTDAMLQF